MSMSNDLEKVADFVWEITRRNQVFRNEVHERFGSDYNKQIWDPNFYWRWSLIKIYDPNVKIEDLKKTKHPINFKAIELCFHTRQDNLPPEAIEYRHDGNDIDDSNENGVEKVFPHSENPNVVLEHNREGRLILYVDSIVDYRGWVKKYDDILNHLMREGYYVEFQDGAFLQPKGFRITEVITDKDVNDATAKIVERDDEKKLKMKDKYKAPKTSVAERANENLRKDFQRSYHTVASLIKHTPHLLVFVK